MTIIVLLTDFLWRSSRSNLSQQTEITLEIELDEEENEEDEDVVAAVLPLTRSLSINILYY